METTTTLTLKQALTIAQRDTEHPIRFTHQEDVEWRAAEKVIIAAGLCPHCACASEPIRSRLEEWQPGNYWQNAGRECPNCGEFIVCGEQPEFENQATEWRGDADPGL
jgi:hypothetical protein